MKCLLISLLLILITLSKTFACLNENAVSLNGEPVPSDGAALVPFGHDLEGNRDMYLEELKERDSLWKTNGRVEDYSDYGVSLVYLGRYDEALKVFVSIEEMKPGLYNTAANLGTTYELLGKNELALQWIKKAVQINPNSHDHSEWLHVKILEAKLGGDKLITSQFLLSTDFGNGAKPTSTLSNEDLIKLGDAIYYQLNERVSFIKPKDKIVALLLFDLGNICAITNNVNSALTIYDKAKEYGYSSGIFEKRYTTLNEIKNTASEQFHNQNAAEYETRASDSGTNSPSFKWGLLGLVTVTGLFFSIRLLFKK